MSHDHPHAPDTDTAPVPGQGSLLGADLLVNMMQRIDELGIAMRNLGRDDNNRFADIVAARLMGNPTFMMRLAEGVVDYSLALQQRQRAEQDMVTDKTAEGLPDPEAEWTQSEGGVDLTTLDSTPIIGMERTHAPAGPDQDMTNAAGEKFTIAPTTELHSRCGFIQFPEATHRLQVEELVENEAGELELVWGTVFFGEETQRLDKTNRYGYQLIEALNGNLVEGRKAERPEVLNLKVGDSAWFTIREIVFDRPTA